MTSKNAQNINIQEIMYTWVSTIYYSRLFLVRIFALYVFQQVSSVCRKCSNNQKKF